MSCVCIHIYMKWMKLSTTDGKTIMLWIMFTYFFTSFALEFLAGQNLYVLADEVSTVISSLWLFRARLYKNRIQSNNNQVWQWCVDLGSTTYLVQTPCQLRCPLTGFFLDELFPNAARQIKLTKELLMTWYQEMNERGDKKWNYSASISKHVLYSSGSFLNESRTWISPSWILMTRRIKWNLHVFIYTVMHNSSVKLNIGWAK